MDRALNIGFAFCRAQAVRLGGVLGFLDSAPVRLMLCLVAAPVIFLRLFGFLFCLTTISNWAILPAIALGGLLAISFWPHAARRRLAVALLSAYMASVYFYGWCDLMNRRAGGQDSVFDVVEATSIVLLTLQCLVRRPRSRIGER